MSKNLRICDSSILYEVASRLYAKHSVKTRLRQYLRLSVCPFDRIISAVPIGSRVLDIGCGTGLLLGLLIDLGRASSAVGFDVNPEVIQRAQQMAEVNGFGGSVMFTNQSIDCVWPTVGELFDAVTMIDVMHHLPPALQRGVFMRAATVLRPGGVMIYKDMARKPTWMALANRLHDLVSYTDWIHYADIEDNIRYARESGLVERKIETFSRVWYRHEMMVLIRK
ncbi:MAG: class I SAM-dependent methyltransferase [Gemmatimonadota bacterium]|nr:class I SAM-dependent methyltransferase [Gemmatimonadota bacterium]